MRSSMQDFPLSIGSILRFGVEVFGDSEVVTLRWTAAQRRRRTYAETVERAARLANALRTLGVDGDDRVATFMWNNAEHLEAYLAVPSMGAVLHTLNIRLFPEQVTYIANHAEDKVIIANCSLVPLLAKVLPRHGDRRDRARRRRGRLSELEACGKQILSYEEVLADASPSYDWPAGHRRAVGRRDVLHQRHDRQPEGRRLLAPLVLAALDVGVHGEQQRPRRRRPDAADRADVPRERVGRRRTPRSCPAPT